MTSRVRWMMIMAALVAVASATSMNWLGDGQRAAAVALKPVEPVVPITVPVEIIETGSDPALREIRVER